MDDPQTPQKAKRRTRHVPLELRIALDTNQLFNGSASDLLRVELSKFIADSRRHDDVKIRWFLPEVVKRERRYQMREAARELLPATAKLERLLGHGLAITPDVLSDRVNAIVDKQISELQIEVAKLDPEKVDWDRIVADSVDRNPPFVTGKHEKGFRDAVIAETFLQLCQQSPKSQRACRIILVTSDEMLATSVSERTHGATNVKILRSLEELKDFVNVVVSDVTEDFINRIREDATRTFFVKDDTQTLYYTAKIGNEVSARYAKELASTPPGSAVRKNETWYIGPNRFSHKKGQRVHWIASIKVEAKAYRIESSVTASNVTLSTGLPPSTLTLRAPRHRDQSFRRIVISGSRHRDHPFRGS
jgi:hypothetical protein